MREFPGPLEGWSIMVTITGPDRLNPVFRIPQPRDNDRTTPSLPAETAPNEVVRTRLNRWAARGSNPGPRD